MKHDLQEYYLSHTLYLGTLYHVYTFSCFSSIVNFAKAAGTTRLVSLLQPGPETFSLFDEVILLAEGHLIYSGPIDEVVDCK